MSKILSPGPHIPCTVAQVRYLEILSNELGFSRASRNAHLLGIIGHNYWKSDIWAISKYDMIKCINEFKRWKEEKNATDR